MDEVSKRGRSDDEVEDRARKETRTEGKVLAQNESLYYDFPGKIYLVSAFWSVSRSLRGQRRAPIEGKFEGPRRGVNTAIETLEELCTGSSMDQEELIANLVARDLSTVLKLFRTCDVAADERGTFKVREWGCRCRRLVNSDEAGVDLRLCGIKFSNCELDTDVHSLNHLLLDKIL